MPDASVFIQWKGTDVSADLHCSCGSASHYDGLFMYAWRCPDCKKVWVMPTDVTPHEASAEELERLDELVIQEDKEPWAHGEEKADA